MQGIFLKTKPDGKKIVVVTLPPDSDTANRNWVQKLKQQVRREEKKQRSQPQ